MRVVQLLHDNSKTQQLQLQINVLIPQGLFAVTQGLND